MTAPVAATPPPPAKPVSSSRLETAYAPSKAPPAPKPAAALRRSRPRAVPTLTADADDDDALRQTQTMRAIAVAKSIDDISSSMAETLFGDAELDLVDRSTRVGGRVAGRGRAARSTRAVAEPRPQLRGSPSPEADAPSPRSPQLPRLARLSPRSPQRRPTIRSICSASATTPRSSSSTTPPCRRQVRRAGPRRAEAPPRSTFGTLQRLRRRCAPCLARVWRHACRRSLRTARRACARTRDNPSTA